MRLTARRFVAIAALALTTFAATHIADVSRQAGTIVELRATTHTTVQAGTIVELRATTHTITPAGTIVEI